MCSDFEQKQYIEETKPIATVHYRGYNIDVYNSDYTQCYYFILEGRQITCEPYNLEYESVIYYEIDELLDYIETIHNDKPNHPSAEVRWMFDQESGERKKVVKYDNLVKSLECQDGDYHDEVKKIMDDIDVIHSGESRVYFSDLMREIKDSEDK